MTQMTDTEIAAGDPAPPPAAAQPHGELADGTVHALDPRVVPFDRVVGLIVTACISVFLLAGALSLLATRGASGPRLLLLLGGWTAVSAALAVYAFVWPPVEYRHTSYRLDRDGIEIRWGVYWRSVITVPRSRVQHMDVSQGPLQRSYGLGTLRIFTAGTEHAHVDLPGLAHERALLIRDVLLPKADEDAV